MRILNLEKRIEVLEAKHAPSNDLGDRWPPMDCDPARLLAQYAAYFEGRPWVCTGTPEKKAQKERMLASYRKYFEQLGIKVTVRK